MSLREIAMRKKFKSRARVYNPETGEEYSGSEYRNRGVEDMVPSQDGLSQKTIDEAKFQKLADDEAEMEELEKMQSSVDEDAINKRAEDEILASKDKNLSAIRKKIFMERMKKMKGVKI